VAAPRKPVRMNGLRPPDARKALRLWFRFDGAAVQLTQVTPLAMRPPPSLPIGEGKALEGVSGAWIELRDSGGRCLWRRLLHDPFGTRNEVSADDGFTNIYRDHPRGIIVELIPDLPEARNVVLVSSPLERERRFKPARDVAAFDLRGRF